MPSPLRSVSVPQLIRIKPGALGRLPIYLQREGFQRVLAVVSQGLPAAVQRHLGPCQFSRTMTVEEASLERLEAIETSVSDHDCVCGVGGGKALDFAKLLASRAHLPYLAVPTSLSNDGFCSPNASLTREGKKVSIPARLPVGVVIDLDIVAEAPETLWLSGVGDLVSKRTAIRDWKIAFHTAGIPFDDLAALLSDATVYQFMACPDRTAEGTRLLAQALLLNGVAMEIAGCSRPASGSEHLISHALDQLAKEPRAHGLQVGLATYWMALLQEQDVSDISQLFETTGFWSYWRANPAPRGLWERALEIAPEVKQQFVTALDSPGARERALSLLETDSELRRCFAESGGF